MVWRIVCQCLLYMYTYVYDTGFSRWVRVTSTWTCLELCVICAHVSSSLVILSLIGDGTFLSSILMFEHVPRCTVSVHVESDKAKANKRQLHTLPICKMVLKYTLSILSVEIDDVLSKDMLVWCFWIPKKLFDADLLLQGRHWQIEAWWGLISQFLSLFYFPNM